MSALPVVKRARLAMPFCPHMTQCGQDWCRISTGGPGLEPSHVCLLKPDEPDVRSRRDARVRASRATRAATTLRHAYRNRIDLERLSDSRRQSANWYRLNHKLGSTLLTEQYSGRDVAPKANCFGGVIAHTKDTSLYRHDISERAVPR